MSRIADSVLELVGATPLVRLHRIPTASSGEVLVKLESHNPAGSVKDRVALAMIEAAEKDGRLKPGDTIVEPTSGNTGIGLALVAAVKGYRLILTMPDDASPERQAILEHFGARVVLTPARKLMHGAITRANEIVAKNTGCFMPSQFENPANPEAHRQTTAKEILDATDSTLSAFVAGVGTGGTLTGVGEALKHAIPNLRVIAVEPKNSQALAGGKVGRHGIQGIGAGFIPKVVNLDIIDEIKTCEETQAYRMAKRLAQEEGISAGISAGAAVTVACEVATQLGKGHRVVAIVPDGWERYATDEGPQSLGGMDFII